MAAWCGVLKHPPQRHRWMAPMGTYQKAGDYHPSNKVARIGAQNQLLDGAPVSNCTQPSKRRRATAVGTPTSPRRGGYCTALSCAPRLCGAVDKPLAESRTPGMDRKGHNLRRCTAEVVGLRFAHHRPRPGASHRGAGLCCCGISTNNKHEGEANACIPKYKF